MLQKIELEHIRQKLKHGDVMRIALRTGYSYSYVRFVLNGERNCDAIIEVAIALASENEEPGTEVNGKIT